MAARAKRKSSTPKKRGCRAASRPSTTVKRGDLPPLRLDLSPQELAELRKEEAELQQARPKSLREGRRLFDRALGAEIWRPRPAEKKIAGDREAPGEREGREEAAGSRTATAAWISAEAKRMKDSGEISAEVRITKFARALEKNMRKAAGTDRSIRPAGWRHIKNMLPAWGLWPISAIK
jgi:hypothetical protein